MGDIVVAITHTGESMPVRVVELMQRSSRLFTVFTEHGRLVTTDEHPLWVGGHDFRSAGELKIGDTVRRWVDGRIVSSMVTGLQPHHDEPEVTVYNMHVEAPHVYVAEGFVVHNKLTPCFPGGTLIATPQGMVPIAALSAGDAVLSVDNDGSVREASIRHTTQYDDIDILVVVTSAGELRTTAPHPVWMGGQRFVPAGMLKAGDVVMMLDGGDVRPATVQALRAEARERVFNLQVEQPYTYVASGFIVH